MQDRFAGDAGDFMTFGLLRFLVGVAPPQRLGVNWYLRADEHHNTDGRHTGYLDPSSRYHRSLRACDPDLMDRLTTVVATGRSVDSLERAGVLPPGSVTYGGRLTSDQGDSGRREWHARAVAALSRADLVFLSPDNGIRTPGRGPKPSKYAFTDELADYTARRQSLVVYQHADRASGGVAAQLVRRFDQLRGATGIDPLGAITTHRGTCRSFIVVPAAPHRDAIATRLAEFALRWADHADYIDCARSA